MLQKLAWELPSFENLYFWMILAIHIKLYLTYVFPDKGHPVSKLDAGSNLLYIGQDLFRWHTSCIKEKNCLNLLQWITVCVCTWRLAQQRVCTQGLIVVIKPDYHSMLMFSLTRPRIPQGVNLVLNTHTAGAENWKISKRQRTWRSTKRTNI